MIRLRTASNARMRGEPRVSGRHAVRVAVREIGDAETSPAGFGAVDAPTKPRASLGAECASRHFAQHSAIASLNARWRRWDSVHVLQRTPGLGSPTTASSSKAEEGDATDADDSFTYKRDAFFVFFAARRSGELAAKASNLGRYSARTGLSSFQKCVSGARWTLRRAAASSALNARVPLCHAPTTW